MASDESDDEPLSVLAACKRLNPDKFITNPTPYIEVKRKKKKKILPPITIRIRKPRVLVPPVVERPTDVWLYLKDLKPSGPYNCLLCTEWFISKPKMIIHYILNHKKDFCGICRYFVPDRSTWWEHVKFHTPWPCSQCIENFPSEAILRKHLSSVHKLVHCRLCHFRVPDDDQYNTHLLQKHNVTNLSSKDEDVLWEVDEDGSTKYFCILCSSSNNTCRAFFNHYMGYHHFTMKCFSNYLSGTDPPFTIVGADVTPEFVEMFKDHPRFGYVDLEDKMISVEETETDSTPNESAAFLNVLIPEVKHEFLSEPEDENKTKAQEEDITKTYRGDEDFDITLLEVILLQQCYYDYVSNTLNAINANTIPENSGIDYKHCKEDEPMDCLICKTSYNKVEDFSVHLLKMHSVKTVPLYSCRVCASTFDTRNELESHISQELGEFEDLWLCQFCDKEFDNREQSRRHLTEHMNVIEFDNCFSPHLGFKCKFCPTLFWNETDRETHQVRVHFSKNKELYYKCEACDELFSDKIWFIHHHMENHHKPDKEEPAYLLKCCACCLVLPTLEGMRAHFETQHPDARKVYCSLDECKFKPLSQRKSFKIHLRMVHTGAPRADHEVTCSICLREFPTQRACSAHAAQVHVSGKFKCKLCRDVLHTVDERKLHYLIKHPGRHPFECTECGKSFQYKSSLYMHKQDHQPNKQNYTCTFCGKVFMKKDSFREHVQIHEGPRHACSYCPMRFVQRSNMLRHERRHTGERPYACPSCPRTFADKGACTSHARTHSKDTSYSCLYCGQTFVQKSKLTYHIRKHTGENLETCPVCSKLFTSRCALREHMKIHNAAKNVIKCPLCDKKYADERYMLRHLRTSHTLGHRLHPCPICRKPFASEHGLRHHVLTHSKVHTYRCKMCPKSCSCKRTMVKHLRRRHGTKVNDINSKDFYIRLDPRQCGLELDEETMTDIFGPPQKAPETILSDLPQTNTGSQKQFTQSTIEIEVEPLIETVVKKERHDEGEEELEPTDFVSVKIEPTDDDEMDRMH